jgi:X-Pro dipeptidyl-peptidase
MYLSRLLFFYLVTILFISTSAIAQDVPTDKPFFKDGEAQVVEGFKNSADWVRHDLWVETEFDSDGNGKNDRVHVSVTRQKQTESGLKVPVVYNTSPYFAGIGSTSKEFMWNVEQEVGADPPERKNCPEIDYRENRPTISQAQTAIWVPRGYAVVHSESPGTGMSEGCPTVGGDNESLAPKAVIDWLNGRAKGYSSIDGDEEVKAFWCTGKVGMTGTSYEGTLPLAAATTGVDGLEAIIPVSPNTSYYHYYRANGLVRHPGGYLGEDIDVLYDFIHSGNTETRETCNCKVRDELLLKKFDRKNGDYNEFWGTRDYMNDLAPLKAATMMVHGLNDWNVMPEHSVRIYEALKKKGVPCKIFLHQGGHGGTPSISIMNRWFTRYLFGVQNGVEDEPNAWVVRESDRRSRPTVYADYPNPEAKPVQLYLGKGGLQSGSLHTSSIESQGTEMLIDDVSMSGADLAAAEKSKHRLLYVTPQLKEPIHLSGRSTLTIKLASSKPAVNLSAWMVSLPWSNRGSINENIITRGWADPQNYKSLTESEALEQGKFYELTFQLEPDDQIIPAGQQIGLMIFSSDRDFTLWPEPGTELTVDLDGTSIQIPVVGGKEMYDLATRQ